ncbi:MAG: glycine--tRNA ligase subunit beta [Tissierellia bacterium]|nr:glycine--tRNA ligase subunit beta [Tissierellia bacterium]
MKSNYLFELGVEEFPASYVEPTKKQLKSAFEKLLDENKICYEGIDVESTPRRFAVIIKGLSQETKSDTKKVKGPSKKIALDDNGEPTKALLGFLKGQGKEFEDIVFEKVGDEEYVFVQKTIEQKPIDEILKDSIPEIIKGLVFPKTMKWGGKKFRFARPIRWIMSVFDNEILEFEFEGIPVSNITRGHRYLGSDNIVVNNIDDYEKLLKENGVILKQRDRKNMILHDANRLSREKGGYLYKDDDLLEEVVNITEYPTPLIGNIKAEFLSLPKEAIITPMKDHQRFFPIIDDNGELLPYFITVRNGGDKGLDEVKKGNEKVLAPRLEDAKFFFEEDTKRNLEEYLEVLKTATFHEELGTIYDKSKRLVKLSKLIGEQLAVGEETIKNTARAALLSKADLVTKLVIEFTELQGIMGMIYANESGENSIVSTAIKEQYLPRYSGDELPKSTAGKILSIADKIDTIVGMYAVGIRVTGSQDPFALRRAALGILNIIIENKLDLEFEEIIRNSLYTYLEDQGIIFDYDLVKKEILDFVKQRLRVKLIDEGNRYDVVDSCFAVGTSNIYYTSQRVVAVNKWVENADDKILQTLTRLENIAKDAEDIEIDISILKEQAELQLYDNLTTVAEIESKIDKKDFEAALREFDSITGSINNFLDNIMVMVDDSRIRANRLALLSRIYKVVTRLFIPGIIVKSQ